jgi:hypothetical protein
MKVSTSIDSLIVATDPSAKQHGKMEGCDENSIILLGQFVGPPNHFCERGHGWTERSFRWIRTAATTKSFTGQPKWWTPNHNSTFVRVPDTELLIFESDILMPYFEIQLADFGLSV